MKALVWNVLCFQLLVTLAACLSCDERSGILSRRAWGNACASSLLFLPSPAAHAATSDGELPLTLRPYTKLAPLGKPERTGNKNKSRNLTLDEIARRLTRDLTQGATNQGGYIISGDLSVDLFRDDCIFLDPTNRVDSLSQYQKALTILFDPDRSVVQLLGPLTVNEDEKTIRGRFRSRGFLKLPWNPFVSAYESDILYKVGEEDGLIYEQVQTWSKSSYQALKESFTPTIFTPPPKSPLAESPPSDEPELVKVLFETVNGRRPEEYSLEERSEIGTLMDKVVEQRYPWKADLFPGTWKLVYFEPGPLGGSGVDRRIPFPEFSFNDQYQVFGGDSSVTNIGQLWGPSVFVRVLGTFQEVDPTTTASPKRLQADITSGQLCFGGKDVVPSPTSSAASCFNLPIQGMGLFESLYLGDRLRILQNLNGTGARGIQIRMRASS